MKKLSLSATLIALLLCQCTAPDKSTSEDPSLVDEGTAFFTSNPLPVPEQEVQTLKIGAKAPDFKLPGVDGRFHSLGEFDDKEVLVIIFTCNHCPTAQAYEDRMKQLVLDYEDRGVQVVAISPNSIRGLLLEECGYTDLGDSFEEMIIRAEAQEFNFPYLYDGDDHAASIQYGPVATPHAYVFDKERRLTYVGRLDASEKPGTANAEDVRAAIESTLTGETPALSSTKTFGCSVKWAWKDQYAKKVNKDWLEKEVALEELTVEGVKELLANDSEKLLLVNFWATWCGPCIIEYPDFVAIHRMFYQRDFEFVSVTMDGLDAKGRALKFLTEKQSAVRNYIYSEDDKYALIDAVDAEWDGALPYTALVAPGGEVVYRVMGEMDPLEVKRKIVEHPMIGRYY